MLENLFNFKVLTRKEQQSISGGIDRCKFFPEGRATPERIAACKKAQEEKENSIS